MYLKVFRRRQAKAVMLAVFESEDTVLTTPEYGLLLRFEAEILKKGHRFEGYEWWRAEVLAEVF